MWTLVLTIVSMRTFSEHAAYIPRMETPRATMANRNIQPKHGITIFDMSSGKIGKQHKQKLTKHHFLE